MCRSSTYFLASLNDVRSENADRLQSLMTKRSRASNDVAREAHDSIYFSQTHIIGENAREIVPFQKHQPVDPILAMMKMRRSQEAHTFRRLTYSLIGPNIDADRHR